MEINQNLKVCKVLHLVVMNIIFMTKTVTRCLTHKIHGIQPPRKRDAENSCQGLRPCQSMAMRTIYHDISGDKMFRDKIDLTISRDKDSHNQQP